MAGIWSQESLDTSTCGIGNDSTDMVSEVNWQWGTHWVLEIGWGWCRNHIFAVRKNPRLTLPCDLRAHMRLGELSSEGRTLHLETLISCLYFQPPSRIYSVSVGCDMAVSCPDPTTHMLVLWGKSFVASSSEKGKFLTWVLWMMMNYEYTQFIPISYPDLSIFHHDVLIWKEFSTYLFWTIKTISLSNNDYFSVMKTNWKMWRHCGEELQGKQETQPLC